MTRWTYRMLLLLCALCLASCGTRSTPPVSVAASVQPHTMAGKEEVAERAIAFIDHIAAGAYEDACAMFSSAMARELSEDQLASAWKQITDAYGEFAFVDWQNASVQPVEDNQVLRVAIIFDRRMELRLSFNQSLQIEGFFILEPMDGPPSAPSPIAPDYAIEEEIAFDSQQDMPMRGTFTIPANGDASIAVVFVHGSGQQDRDETIGANAPFRDLAWGLAELGIASLRYDKSSYLYAFDADTFTVDQETALDAVAAAQWLRSEKGAGYVFIVGHSQGGMLASYIQSMGAGADGLILLAGSPRGFTDLIIDQNLLAKQAYVDQDMRKEAAEVSAYLAAEMDKLAVWEASGQSSQGEIASIFGLPLHYLAHWSRIDAAALHMEYDVPVLLLQGGRDVQVYAGVDFALWREKLADHPDSTFKLYDDLNHIFGAYSGEPTTILNVVQDEYGVRTPVDQRVIDDIAEWILNRTNR